MSEVVSFDDDNMSWQMNTDWKYLSHSEEWQGCSDSSSLSDQMMLLCVILHTWSRHHQLAFYAVSDCIDQ